MDKVNFLTRNEAAKLLNISTRTLDRRVAKGAIPTVRHKGNILFEKEKIKELKNNLDKPFTEVLKSSNKDEKLPVVKDQYEKMLNVFLEQTRKEIEKKDQKIQELSYHIGSLEEKLKSSVPLLESKKYEENLQKKLYRAKIARITFLILFIALSIFFTIFEIYFR